MMWRLLLLLLALSSSAAHAQASACPRAPDNARLIVVSDIGNEPDDAESLVRLLLYTNEIDLEALIPSTSVWQHDRIRPDLMRERIRAYGEVLTKLRAHDCRYPEAAALDAMIRDGTPTFGMRGVGPGKDTDGSRALIAAIDRPDPRPLWIALWGGAADLAQALQSLRATRTAEQLKLALSKLRVYAISDQDDAGPWIRREFPELFWVGSIHAFSDYARATWRGISGELYRRPADSAPELDGPDSRLVTNAWIARNIQFGPLGRLYPDWKFAMEGDTPSFLNLIRNGLADPEHPEWGGWGGRYGKVSQADGLYTDATDEVLGVDGKRYRDNLATIWRWREAFQNDFAARIGWTLTSDPRKARHTPVVVLNGIEGTAALTIPVKPGEAVDLDAGQSRDPDGDGLDFSWTVYAEASGLRSVPGLALEGATTAHARVMLPAIEQPVHLILSVRSHGVLPLTRYRRIILVPASASSSPGP